MEAGPQTAQGVGLVVGVCAPAATFPHPLDALPVTRTFTAQARACLPASILADAEHPWLERQERRLPRGVLGVIYYRDGVELLSPQGVRRRPFRGEIDLRAPEDAPSPRPAPRSAKQVAAAERTRAWRLGNREKVRAQSTRLSLRRKTERSQLIEAAAATDRAA